MNNYQRECLAFKNVIVTVLQYIWFHVYIFTVLYLNKWIHLNVVCEYVNVSKESLPIANATGTKFKEWEK